MMNRLAFSLAFCFVLCAYLSAADSTEADPHAGIYATEGRFPSASTCRSCHESQYRDWSVSMHAFAQLSPTMEAQSAEITRQFNGTIGVFCTRCHTPVGTTMGEGAKLPNAQRSPVSLEGVTCVVCHRINTKYGKVVGNIAFAQGDQFAKVFGGLDGKEVEAIAKTGGIATAPGKQGAQMHATADFFEPMTTSAFCGQCHEVINPAGVHLQDTYSQWQSSQAARDGTRCQDCHMGTISGIKSPYAVGPAAVLPDGRRTKDRPLANHMIVGPDVPTEHPGVFPHGARDNRGASMDPDDKEKLEELLADVDDGFLAKLTSDDWWHFDYRAGWGTEAFEAAVAKDYPFPAMWNNLAKRKVAAEYVRQQLALIEESQADRVILFKNGAKIDALTLASKHTLDTSFTYEVVIKSLLNGHNNPSAFGWFRQLWIHTTVADHQGVVVFASGDLDPINDDLRHSFNNRVVTGQIANDDQLWCSQAWLTARGEHGADRTVFFPIGTETDPTAFLRPAAGPASLRGKDNGFRIDQSQVLPPLGARTATYRVPPDAWKKPGTYTVTATLRMRGIPPYFYTMFGLYRNIRFVTEAIVDVDTKTHQVIVEAAP